MSKGSCANASLPGDHLERLDREAGRIGVAEDEVGIAPIEAVLVVCLRRGVVELPATVGALRADEPVSRRRGRVLAGSIQREDRKGVGVDTGVVRAVAVLPALLLGVLDLLYEIALAQRRSLPRCDVSHQDLRHLAEVVNLVLVVREVSHATVDRGRGPACRHEGDDRVRGRADLGEARERAVVLLDLRDVMRRVLGPVLVRTLGGRTAPRPPQL